MADESMFSPLGTEGKQSNGTPSPDDWGIVSPVQPDAPEVPLEHFRLGMPSRTWTYRDAAGQLLGHVHRFELPDGKQTLPFTLWHNRKTGEFKWRQKSWPDSRPLFNLHLLARNGSSPVIIVEGEKCAEAGQNKLSEMGVWTTCPGGALAFSKADWSPLKGRVVILWRDNDEPGERYERGVAKAVLAAGATSVSIVRLPKGKDTGWDVANCLDEDPSGATATTLIKSAVQLKADDQARKGSHRARLAEFREGIFEFREAWSGEPMVSYHDGFRLLNCHVRDRQFHNHLVFSFEKAEGRIPSSQSIEDFKRSVEARCVRGPLLPTFRRVGRDDEAIYLDLAEPAGRLVKVTAEGVGETKEDGVKFLRTGPMLEMPVPVCGYKVEALAGFMNLDDVQFKLVVGWLLGCLRGGGPYPILVLNGEQGSGKSFLTRLLRKIIDPSSIPLRSLPRDEKDLLIAAVNSFILVFDNVSSLPASLSDALSRMATGSGFGTRKLHTDTEESVMWASRPIILNGIPDFVQSADLAERSIVVHLPRISSEKRRTESEIVADFDLALPEILGALLDACSVALKRLPHVRLKSLPRLADFALFVEACAPALGWGEGEFLEAFSTNKAQINEVALESDPVAMAIVAMMRGFPDGVFEGTPSELYTKLNETTPEGQRKSKFWPTGPSSMGSRFRRVAPLLRTAGFEVESRKSGARTIRIVMIAG